ncbi:MAG: PEP-CTERM sorting domain-containing protein [Candidatus Thiodiazotropha sp.]
MKRILKIVLTGLLGLAFNAQATMIGDTINGSGDTLTPGIATIGAGVEFEAVGGYLDFDFDENLLTVSTTGLFSWSGHGDYVFSGFTDVITGMSLTSNTFASGFTDFWFDDHSITLDGDSGRRGDVPSVAIFAIQTYSDAEPDTDTHTNVPEPSTLFLLGAGIVGISVSRFRLSRN